MLPSRYARPPSPPSPSSPLRRSRRRFSDFLQPDPSDPSALLAELPTFPAVPRRPDLFDHIQAATDAWTSTKEAHKDRIKTAFETFAMAPLRGRVKRKLRQKMAPGGLSANLLGELEWKMWRLVGRGTGALDELDEEEEEIQRSNQERGLDDDRRWEEEKQRRRQQQLEQQQRQRQRRREEGMERTELERLERQRVRQRCESWQRNASEPPLTPRLPSEIPPPATLFTQVPTEGRSRRGQQTTRRAAAAAVDARVSDRRAAPATTAAGPSRAQAPPPAATTHKKSQIPLHLPTKPEPAKLAARRTVQAQAQAVPRHEPPSLAPAPLQPRRNTGVAAQVDVAAANARTHRVPWNGNFSSSRDADARAGAPQRLQPPVIPTRVSSLDADNGRSQNQGQNAARPRAHKRKKKV